VRKILFVRESKGKGSIFRPSNQSNRTIQTTDLDRLRPLAPQRRLPQMVVRHLPFQPHHLHARVRPPVEGAERRRGGPGGGGDGRVRVLVRAVVALCVVSCRMECIRCEARAGDGIGRITCT
jgi:hypothetical protein